MPFLSRYLCEMLGMGINMRKKTNFLLALIAAIALASGCTYGSGSSTGSVELNTFSRMSASYQKFNGYKTTDLHVKEGEAVEVSVNIVSKEGKLDFLIIKEADKKAEKNQKDETVYEENNLPTSDFKVILDKPGDYKITVTAKEHKGSYKITWDKADKKG